MRLVRMPYMVFILSFFLVSTVSLAQNQVPNSSPGTDLAPLGFQFKISKKEAMRIIDSNHKAIVQNNVDSKEIRTIVIHGVVVDLPLDINGKEVHTVLEFYDKKLLSTSLSFVSLSALERVELRNKLINYLNERYGKPNDEDSMLYFNSWTWQTPKVKLVLHTNKKDNTMKIEYTYRALSEAKYEDELDKRRNTEKIDPAREMFIEGDYSKPTGYDERYRITK